MPKVGKHICRHLDLKISIQADINFGHPTSRRSKNDSKRFWMKYPDDVSEYIGQVYVFGSSLETVTQEFDKLVIDFYSRQKKKKKVIAYKFESQHLVSEPPNDRDRNRIRDYWVLRGYEKGQNAEQNLSFEYRIGFITSLGEKNFFSEKESKTGVEVYGNSYNYYSDFKFIDWTKEREEWFSETYDSLTKLIKKCRAFFIQPEKKFVDSISKQKLLQ